MAEIVQDHPADNTRVLAGRIGAVGWGLFFIWMGIAFLADVGWGVGLLGVGVITLGGELARKYFGLAFEPFWVVIGLVFLVWGAWELLGIQLGKAAIPTSFLPILCIAVGIVVVASAFLRKSR